MELHIYCLGMRLNRFFNQDSRAEPILCSATQFALVSDTRQFSALSRLKPAETEYLKKFVTAIHSPELTSMSLN